MHQDCFQKKISAECECSLMVFMCDIIQKALESHNVQDCTWLKNIQLPFWRNQTCHTYKFYSCLNTVKVRGGSLTLSFWRNSAVLKNRMFLVVSDVRRTQHPPPLEKFLKGGLLDFFSSTPGNCGRGFTVVSYMQLAHILSVYQNSFSMDHYLFFCQESTLILLTFSFRLHKCCYLQYMASSCLLL